MVYVSVSPSPFLYFSVPPNRLLFFPFPSLIFLFYFICISSMSFVSLFLIPSLSLHILLSLQFIYPHFISFLPFFIYIFSCLPLSSYSPILAHSLLSLTSVLSSPPSTFPPSTPLYHPTKDRHPKIASLAFPLRSLLDTRGEVYSASYLSSHL